MARLDLVDRPAVLLSGVGNETSVYRDRARRLGLPFAAAVRLGGGAIVDVAAIQRGTFAMSAEGDRTAYIAPDEAAMAKVADWLATYRPSRCRLAVATPSEIRAALIEAGAAGLADDAVHRLEGLSPDMSARRVVTGRQLAVGLAAAAGIGLAAHAAPGVTFVTLNIVTGIFFFGVSALRFVAAAMARTRRIRRAPAPAPDAPLPVYTILVPMLREARLVRDLVAALDRTNWPRDRLDIKLIVEATDPTTVSAARMAVDGPPYEVIVVPPVGPLTKPKALAFALPWARGELITVYDAEDRPHPLQLREAHAVFSRNGPELACLQSPIEVDNNDSILERLFAVEYAALFDGLLPGLADLGMPLPLGGTSNHFRRDALERVGGWDPFNVTEDADIGFRLARSGYRIATLDLPTVEEAPARLRPWLKQRRRWYKGWMQTWLVHMRRPLGCARELGSRGFLGFNLIGTGLVLSALVHPVYLATIAVLMTDPLQLWGDGGVVASATVGLNLFNLCAGYVAFAVLAKRALALRGRRAKPHLLMLLPFYMLLMSLASYRALADLVVRPHYWDKTPHHGRRPSPAESEPSGGQAARPVRIDQVRRQMPAHPRRGGQERRVGLDRALDRLAAAQRQRQLQRPA